MSSEQYLEEGFDPHSLKMSAIRSILLKHNVEYPSNAKKTELLALLQETVLARAPKLRKEAKRRVKGDGHDIEQVAGTSAGTAASIGQRTRSQTPRTERVRPPELAPKASNESVARDADGQRVKKKKKSKKPKSDKELDKALVRELAKELTKAPPAQEQLTPPRPALGRAADVKRMAGAKRKLSDAEQSADSGDEDVFTPARKQMGDAQRLRIAKQRRERHQDDDRADRNFSDENPFQSSPEAARKRRRKASTDERSTTPMSALRKSQVSDLSFRVALPKSPEQRSSPPTDDQQPPSSPILYGSADPLPLESDDLALPHRLGGRVGDLVARYQNKPTQQQQPAPPRSPTVRIRDELPRPPSAEAMLPDLVPIVEIEQPARGAVERPPPLPAPRTSHGEAARARFTMTPDALRQLAAGAEQPRRTTMASGFPPVAPGILPAAAVPRYAPAARPASRERVVAGDTKQLSIAQAELEAQDLQRRRVATLRQHVDSSEDAAAQHRHSRRSSIASIASSVGEARGIPAVPAAAAAEKTLAADAGPRRHQQQQDQERSMPWGLRVFWLAVLGGAALVWRAHEQFGVGFGSARSDYAPVAPPVGSALWLPPPVADDAPPAERALYFARYVRAAFVQPPALECPEHADCVPFTPLPAASAAAGPGEAVARDQWVVPVVDPDAAAGTPREQLVAVVQCDAGYVLQFPWLASRVFPLPPQCVRDESTELRVRQLVDAMAAECSAKRGRAQCEMTLLEQVRELLSAADTDADAEDDADEIERLGLSTAELRREMLRRKSPRLTDDEFDVVFRLAAEELGDRDDLVTNYVVADESENGGGNAEGREMTFFVARGAHYPLACHARRALLALLLRNVTALAAMVAVGVLAFVASRRYAAHRAEVDAADALVGSALARLKRQAKRHYLDPALSPSPAIPSLQLRDLLLLSSSTPPTSGATPQSGFMTPTRGEPRLSVAAYYDPRARNSVWERVRRVVERNANVRCRTTSVRGEPMRVWEWIGPIDDDDDADVFSPFGSPMFSD
ncbi:hypothetical protein H4R19_000643 [Coemansia spiralis]|nr:hypothetical protein H4R19_000643 [Coemansia spiralis]